MDEEAITKIFGELGLCGCGQPEEAAVILCKTLALIDRIRSELWEKKLTYEQWSEEEKKLFPLPGSACLTYYFLDTLQLIEHGGSVPGWLTPKGFLFLGRLQKATSEN